LAIVRGGLVNKIVGIQTAEAIKDLVDGCLHFAYYPELQPLLSEATAKVTSGSLPEAAKIFHAILTTRKFKAEPLALCGLAQCALKEGNVKTAKQLADQAVTSYPKFVNHPFVKQVTSQVALHKEGSQTLDASKLLSQIEKDPNDMQARYDLGVLYAQAGDYEKCLDQMFQSIKIDREWNQQAAKKFLIETLNSMGDPELASKGRKKLQNLWFR